MYTPPTPTPKPRNRSSPANNKTTNTKTSKHQNPETSSSSTSTLTSLKIIASELEPPPNLLPSKLEDLLKLLAVLIIASIVSLSCHFLTPAFSRLPSKPFCDSDINININVNVLDFDDSLLDSCEPCPSNGRCYKGQLECNQGYRRHGKLCVEDGDINQSAHRLSEWARNHLCEQHAKYMCDGTGTVWVSEGELKNILDNYGSAESSSSEDIRYLFIKERAFKEVDSLLISRSTVNGGKEFKCPDELAESFKPMTCRIRLWVAQNLLFLIPVCALLMGCTFSLARVRRRWQSTKRAEQLYRQICDILEENALMSKSMGDREPWLVASRIRDHLLSPKERRDPLLWKMVEELVELDSRLDRYPKLVKGESKVVWEWQVEGSLSSSKKRKEEVVNSD